MPKRLTATEKWSKRWFRRLSCHQKLIWFYLCDNCDHCGVWDGDTEMAEIVCGLPTGFDWQAFVDATSGRVVVFGGGKYFLAGFCAFQYPKGLDPKILTTKNVAPRLLRLGLLALAQRAYDPETHEKQGTLPEPFQKGS